MPELDILDSLPITTDDIATIRSKTSSLFNLYEILIGCIQILTGVIMAKRQDELVSLKSHGNLEPNIVPTTKNGQQTEYWLTATLKKSGCGGQLERNDTIKRPIPHSFALLI